MRQAAQMRFELSLCVSFSVCVCVGDFITFVVDFVFFFDFPKKFLIKSKRGGTGGCDGGHSK